MAKSRNSEREQDEQEVATYEFKKNMSDYTNRIKYKGEEFTLTKHGNPVARVVPVDDALNLSESPKKGGRK